MKKTIAILITCIAGVVYADATPTDQCGKAPVVAAGMVKKKAKKRKPAKALVCPAAVIPAPVVITKEVEKIVKVADPYPVIRLVEKDKLIRPHHHLQLLGGYGPSGLEYESLSNGLCQTDTITQDYGLVGGLGYSYIFNNGFSIGLIGLINDRLKPTGLGSLGWVW